MNNTNYIADLIENAVTKNIESHRKLLVAYSGGVDSTVLLHVLVKLRDHFNLEVKAVHIHHGISKNADYWANHCEKQCQNWNVPFFVESVHIDFSKGNIEEQARQARYQTIQLYLHDDETLCTAQHLDDQCETFLLALKRGSGPTGLSAMANLSKFGQNHLLRPLLSISRLQIEEYAKSHHLFWIEDESNQDNKYDRNFLRLNILPILNQRWHHFSKMVSRSAELCQEQQALLEELLSDLFSKLIDDEYNLLFQPLLTFSAEKYNAIIRMWFKLHQQKMPSRKQLQILRETLLLARQDSNPKFEWHNKQIRRYQDKLYFLPKYQDLRSIQLDWNINKNIELPDNLGTLSCAITQKNNCRLPESHEKVSVRFHVEGSYRIVGRKHSRQIKKIWQELNVSPWMRTRIPLIFYNDTLITAVNLFVTEEGRGNTICFSIGKEETAS